LLKFVLKIKTILNLIFWQGWNTPILRFNPLPQQYARMVCSVIPPSSNRRDDEILSALNSIKTRMDKLEEKVTVTEESFKASMGEIKTRMGEIEKTLNRVQTSFDSVYETMVRCEQNGFMLQEQTLPLVVNKPSDLFYFCTSFQFDESAVLAKVMSHIETIFPIFLQSFVSGKLDRADFNRFLTAPDDSRGKSVYLKECMNTCKVGLRMAESNLDAATASTVAGAAIPNAAQVKELKKDLEKWTHAKSTMECISEFCLVPDISKRFDSKLGLMVLLWNTDKETILRSLEIDIRGELKVVSTDSAGAAPPGSDAGSSVGVADDGASSPPAKKITAYMSECKMNRRMRQNAVAQLTLRLKLLRSFLLEAGLATEGRDSFDLEGRIYLPAGSRLGSLPEQTQTTVDAADSKTILRMSTIWSNIKVCDGASSGSDDDGGFIA
jgi:hypothetical protein